MPSYSSQVAASSDDAAQTGTTVNLTQANLTCNTTIVWNGFRLTGIRRQFTGQVVVSASVSVNLPDASFDSPGLNISFEDADDAATFTTGASNISNRPKTATVAWNGTDIGTGTQVSPELKAILQAVLDRAGFADNNAIAVFFNDAGTGGAFRVTAYDGTPASALVLQYRLAENQVKAQISIICPDATYSQGSGALEPDQIPATLANSARTGVAQLTGLTPAQVESITSISGQTGVAQPASLQPAQGTAQATMSGRTGTLQLGALTPVQVESVTNLSAPTASVSLGGLTPGQTVVQIVITARNQSVEGGATMHDQIAAQIVVAARTPNLILGPILTLQRRALLFIAARHATGVLSSAQPAQIAATIAVEARTSSTAVAAQTPAQGLAQIIIAGRTGQAILSPKVVAQLRPQIVIAARSATISSGAIIRPQIRAIVTMSAMDADTLSVQPNQVPAVVSISTRTQRPLYPYKFTGNLNSQDAVDEIVASIVTTARQLRLDSLRINTGVGVITGAGGYQTLENILSQARAAGMHAFPGIDLHPDDLGTFTQGDVQAGMALLRPILKTFGVEVVIAGNEIDLQMKDLVETPEGDALKIQFYDAFNWVHDALRDDSNGDAFTGLYLPPGIGGPTQAATYMYVYELLVPMMNDGRFDALNVHWYTGGGDFILQFDDANVGLFNGWTAIERSPFDTHVFPTVRDNLGVNPNVSAWCGETNVRAIVPPSNPSEFPNHDAADASRYEQIRSILATPNLLGINLWSFRPDEDKPYYIIAPFDHTGRSVILAFNDGQPDVYNPIAANILTSARNGSVNLTQLPNLQGRAQILVAARHGRVIGLTPIRQDAAHMIIAARSGSVGQVASLLQRQALVLIGARDATVTQGSVMERTINIRTRHKAIINLSSQPARKLNLSDDG